MKLVLSKKHVKVYNLYKVSIYFMILSQKVCKVQKKNNFEVVLVDVTESSIECSKKNSG
jgi:hypothetical protein